MVNKYSAQYKRLSVVNVKYRQRNAASKILHTSRQDILFCRC